MTGRSWLRVDHATVLGRLGGSVLCLLIFAIPSSRAADPVARDATAQPFSSRSVWNTPIGSGAIFQGADDAETALLRNQNAGGHAGAFAWIGGHAFGVYRQRANDPTKSWAYRSRPATVPWPFGGTPGGGQFEIKTPAKMAFLGGTDGHAVIIDEEGRFAYEIWRGRYDAIRDAYTAQYIVRTDLFDTGISHQTWGSEGVRAFGGSLLGGLVRRPELDAGEIRHAIAMATSTSQTSAKQTVWPASYTDGGGRNDHTGLIPMGALFAIPPDVQIDSIGLRTPEGRALARAFQQFGGYVVDTSDRTLVVAYLEDGCSDAQIDNLQADKDRILRYLTMVLNGTKDAPGGPGDRVAPPPPPLRSE